jgi:hypothetical protein
MITAEAARRDYGYDPAEPTRVAVGIAGAD